MSNSSKIIVVLGATGQQGGAVAAALRAESWAVRAVVRDPESAKAEALVRAGVETVRGDLGDPRSLRAAFAGAHGLFSVQPSPGQAGSGLTIEDEFSFAKNVGEAAQHAGVAHLVHTSTVAAGATPTGVPHLDVKSRIEDHLRTLNLLTTIVRPAGFMDTVLLPGMGLDKGQISYLMRPERALQFIAVRDIGRIVAAVFADPERYVGQTFEIAGDEVTGNELAGHLAVAIGSPVRYRRFAPELLGQTGELADNGRLAGHADLAALRARFPFLLTFPQWLAGPGAAHLEQARRPAQAITGLR
ncbi:NmrA/HSCARG family protein [Kineosporia babensis]|uniref:NmrA/HSCARG family protein n=1 Tax=Kineosporia babensis TaxID=499548 RepID=A0A9X1SXW4_9ACTN|nr:NmrA/HSCARG family protein [Kineosporia babensis]MCD5316632.1 NmrA/HSCARG family protein [Kineosporia babensis]